ncbi:putative ankyrin repeat protein RF_0381 [Cryptotermes secundus]|uniref:putative ankyrin repeat protein RF_0381 n=1 Tax=Cryptotermes secundus TaxID=105785 RepID=UPI000CD7D371|nr:putative ankyrin repeat protein RF_0381 [Cryptotermes secundus]
MSLQTTSSDEEGEQFFARGEKNEYRKSSAISSRAWRTKSFENGADFGSKISSSTNTINPLWCPNPREVNNSDTMDNGVPTNLSHSAKFTLTDTDTDSPLHSAVQHGHLDLIRLLIEQGVDVDTRATFREQTPVHIAAKLGEFNCLKLLASYGGSLTSLDGTEKGFAPIHLAILTGNDAIALWLLENGVSVNTESMAGISPLFCAIRCRNTQLVKVLIEKGADVNAKIVNMDGITPLHSAVLVKDVDIFKILLENGADFTAFCNFRNQTVIHSAAAAGNLEMFLTMVRYNADMSVQTNNEKGDRPIHLAASMGHVSIVEWLIENGISMEIINKEGHTPLHRAAFRGKIRVVKLLLKKGADVNIRTKNKERNTENIDHLNAFDCAAMVGGLRCLKVLLIGNTVKSGGNKYGDFPIHFAAAYGHLDVVDWLIDRGSAVDIRNNMGSTPLINASWGGHCNVARMLLDRGADVNATVEKADNRSVIHSASFSGNAQLVELLLERGATVNARTSTNNRTPLHWAAQEGHLETVRLLIKHGAEAKAQDIHGLTAESVAFSKGRAEVVSFFSSLNQ